MNKLRMIAGSEVLSALAVKPTECPPRCGQCCVGGTQIGRPDVDRILEYVNATPQRLKALVKQIRFWNRDLAWCPFLGAAKQCTIYEGRPEICKAFGHVPAMECTIADFEQWEPDSFIKKIFDDADRYDKITTMALLGEAIVAGLKKTSDGVVGLEIFATTGFRR